MKTGSVSVSDIGEKCFGCGICAAGCPARAIHMEPDNEGFLYPSVDETKCNYCGRCKELCPALSAQEHATPRAYALRCLDDELLRKSTSGGAFSLISASILAMGGEVCGAVFDEELSVHHCISTDISPMRKSKYVQSDLRSILPALRSRLEAGKIILFSGTPCQCDAVRSYTGAPAKLYTAATVCMGVLSPGLWKSYKQLLEKGGRLSDYCFRSKKYLDDAHTITYSVNGKSVSRPFSADPLMQLYVRGMILRDSCYTCPYTRADVPFDFTLGDFHGIADVIPELADGKGTSLVFTRSEKAEALMNSIRDHCLIRAVAVSDCMQPSLSRPVSAPELRVEYKRLCASSPEPELLFPKALRLAYAGGRTASADKTPGTQHSTT